MDRRDEKMRWGIVNRSYRTYINLNPAMTQTLELLKYKSDTSEDDKTRQDFALKPTPGVHAVVSPVSAGLSAGVAPASGSAVGAGAAAVSVLDGSFGC